MTRISRNDILYDGCYAHVISRSIRKIKLFKDEEDFKNFKQLLLRTKGKGKFKIYHYCLMQTHFHLVVRMNNVKDFSFAMRDIKRSYVTDFHTKYKLSGPMWRERYRSLLIENEAYLFACGKYIEENPVKAGLISRSAQWPYSSSRHYEQNQPDELVDAYDKDIREIKRTVIDKAEFERGSVIGSSFFRFQFFESRKRFRPVP